MDIILLLKYILLGLVQGFTEPLPISSSGHLVIFEKLLNIELHDFNFEIIVNAGSLVAIIFIYRMFLKDLISKNIQFVFKKKTEFKADFIYVLLLILAVIPAGLIGFIFKDRIEEHLKTLFVVGITLIITALALFLVNMKSRSNEKTEISTIDAIVIGLFQVVALIPGISRSGATMVGGLSRNIKFEDTMRFSFMLYIPISFAALLLGLMDLDTSTIFIPGYIAGFIVSTIGTYFAVKFLFNIVKKGNLKYFSIYCLTVGTIVIILNFV